MQLVTIWDTQKVICRWKISTISTLSITQVWKWLLPKELYHITLTAPRKHTCNHAIFFLFLFSFEAYFSLFFVYFAFCFHFLLYNNTINILLCKCYTLPSTTFIICTQVFLIGKLQWWDGYLWLSPRIFLVHTIKRMWFQN